MAIENHFWNGLEYTFFQSIAHFCYFQRRAFLVTSIQFKGFGKTNYSRDIFRTGAKTRLLTASIDQRLDIQTATDKEAAYAFGAIKFMGGNGQKVDA